MDAQRNRTHGMSDPNQPPVRKVKLHRPIFAISESSQSCENQIDGSGIVLPADFFQLDVSVVAVDREKPHMLCHRHQSSKAPR